MHMTVLFWISALIVGYVYVGYPCLLAVWARARRLGGRAARRSRTALAVDLDRHRRAQRSARLPARIDNLLEPGYPGPREIIVVSDGSTDAPAAALAAVRRAASG